MLMVYIYILQLENDKYYVGKSNSLIDRLDNFIVLSDWTKKYKPIKIMEQIPNCDDFDEDKYTLKYMKEYDISNVRGGSFYQSRLSPEHMNTIMTMINCNKSDPFSCQYCSKTFKTQNGATFHEIKTCKKSTVIDDWVDVAVENPINHINIDPYPIDHVSVINDMNKFTNIIWQCAKCCISCIDDDHDFD
jgi:hypothetical protein